MGRNGAVPRGPAPLGSTRLSNSASLKAALFVCSNFLRADVTSALCFSESDGNSPAEVLEDQETAALFKSLPHLVFSQSASSFEGFDCVYQQVFAYTIDRATQL